MTIGNILAPLAFIAGCAALGGCATVAVPDQAGERSTSATIETDGPPQGAAAPNFVGPASDGTTVSLSTLRGRTVVLWFFGRAETPNAVREAIDFRDATATLRSQGVLLVGVSTDTLEAQTAFAKRLNLQFPLVADPQASVMRAYGVPVTYGVGERRTFVINANGTIEKVYKDVDPASHVSQVVKRVAEPTS